MSKNKKGKRGRPSKWSDPYLKKQLKEKVRAAILADPVNITQKELCADLHISKLNVYEVFDVENFTQLKELILTSHDKADLLVRGQKTELALKQKIKDLKAQNKQLLKESIEFESFFSSLYTKMGPISLHVKKANVEDLMEDTSNTEYIALISDTHVGENVMKDHMLNFGHYNIDIFIQRLQHMAEVIKEQTYGKLIKKLHIFCIGDIVSGLIHDELLETADITVVDSVLIAFKALIHFIEELRPHFKEIEINGVVGNHGRLRKKYHFKNKYNNLDYFTYKFIETYIDASGMENVTCDFTQAPMFVKGILGNRILVTHGDNIKSHMGIPHYGIRRFANNITTLFSDVNAPNYIMMGHFHNSSSLQEFKTTIIMNGSMIGPNEFSLSLGLGARPSQKLLVVEPKYGIRKQIDITMDHEDIYKSKIRWKKVTEV